MTPLRVTDGYIEVAAIPTKGNVELFIVRPGNQGVLQVHVPERLLVRLAVWTLWWWARDRFCGWKTRQELQRVRRYLREPVEEAE